MNISTRVRIRVLFAVFLLLGLMIGCGKKDGPMSPDGGGDGAEDQITIAPPEAALRPNNMQTFTATVTDLGDDGVIWSILESPDGGMIRRDGIYTAPSGGGQFHVIAASVANPAIQDTALVSVGTEWECTGPATDETFELVWSVAVDFTNNRSNHEGVLGAAWNDGIWACDQSNHFVGKLSRTGTVLGWSGRGWFNGEWPDDPVETYTGWHGGTPTSEDGAVSGMEPGQFWKPLGVSVDPTGNVYICEIGNKRVQKLSPGGIYITHWDSAGPDDPRFVSPTAIAVGDNSFVYMIDWYRKIHKFDQHGTWIATIGRDDIEDCEICTFHDLAIDGDGYLYVSDITGGIHRLDADLEYIGRVNKGDATPCDLPGSCLIEVGSDGYIYVVGYDWNDRLMLKKYDRDGKYLAGSDITGYGSPSGMAMDEEDNLYFTDEACDQLSKFRPVP